MNNNNQTIPKKDYILYYVWIDNTSPEIDKPFWHYLGWNRNHAIYWTSDKYRQSPWDECPFKDSFPEKHIKFWSHRDVENYLGDNKMSKLNSKYIDMIWNLKKQIQPWT